MLTFRQHPNEPTVLDTFLSLFFASEIIQDAIEYKWNIEKDGTPDRHFHIFFTTDGVADWRRDATKIKNKLTTKDFKVFKIWLSKKDTEFKHGLHVRLVSDKIQKRNDRLYSIGYVSKDTPHCVEGLPDTFHKVSLQETTQALKYMVEKDRLTALTKDKTKVRDIKNLTSKNVHSTVMDFYENHDIPLNSLIWEYMDTEWIFSDFISEQQKSSIIGSLRRAYKIDTISKTHQEQSLTFTEWSKLQVQHPHDPPVKIIKPVWSTLANGDPVCSAHFQKVCEICEAYSPEFEKAEAEEEKLNFDGI